MNTSIRMIDESIDLDDKDTVVKIQNGNFHWGVLTDNDKKFIQEYSKVLTGGKGGKGKGTKEKSGKSVAEASQAEQQRIQQQVP